MYKIAIIGLMMLATVVGSAQPSDFSVQIFQNGKEVKNSHDVFELKSEEFFFQIKAKGYEGFLIGATLDEDLYRSALGGADLDVNWFAETGMAEGMFNDDKSMFVSNDAPSYWYYEGKDNHRFDHDPEAGKGWWRGSRTVSNLYDIVSEKEIDLSQYKGSLYLYFYAPIYNDDYELIDRKELFHAELKFK